jgi:hypothetical protein
MLGVFLSIVVLTGCVSDVAVTGAPGLAPTAATTATPEEHGLGVIAVDFDPALEYDQILLDGGVSLLVAVQNSGLSDEADVQVTARLIDPAADAADAADALLLNETVIVPAIEAGELQVVRFSQVTQLPLRDSYRLEVSVAPVSGEDNTSDNDRSYDIVISQGD